MRTSLVRGCTKACSRRDRRMLRVKLAPFRRKFCLLNAANGRLPVALPRTALRHAKVLLDPDHARTGGLRAAADAWPDRAALGANRGQALPGRGEEAPGGRAHEHDLRP